LEPKDTFLSSGPSPDPTASSDHPIFLGLILMYSSLSLIYVVYSTTT
jgi:hypothetical protein